MTPATLDTRPELFDALGALVGTPHAEAYTCFCAHQTHGVRALRIERPTLGVLLRGRMRLRGDDSALSMTTGDAFVFTRACSVDTINEPDAAGVFLALVVPLCDEVIAAARLLWARPGARGGPDAIALPALQLSESLASWAASLRRDDPGAARAALASALVALCALGHSAILAPTPPTLAARIRARVAETPDRAWQSSDFETEFGLSGATLRRHLAIEGVGLRDTITDARLACALHWLYTTRWPIQTIAARVGYRSAATFSRRFARRYGAEPLQIGKDEAQSAAAVADGRMPGT
jgi:AraC-like DNA-binding protein